MELLLFASLWTHGFDLTGAISECRLGHYDGIEGPIPKRRAEAVEFSAMLRDSELPFIAEIATGDGYVPRAGASLNDHLLELRRMAEAAAVLDPLFLTVLGGSDAWPIGQAVEFFGRAMLLAREFDVRISFETHRSRPTFNPWSTREILSQLPEMRLTCDFSHWCCVCERLVMDEDPDLLTLCASRADHVHARIGYDQGPQAPHPAAPEYEAALLAHERWWSAIWSAQEARGRGTTTMTPESGPDGYLHMAPFTREPVADLAEINRWIAQRQRERFRQRDAAVAA